MKPREQPREQDLLADLEQPGCPVCRGAARTARRSVDAILHESTDDGPVRARLRAAHGFCHEHALLAVQMAGTDGHGLAIIYADVVDHLDQIATGAGRRGGGRWRPGRRRDRAADGLGPTDVCLVCEAADRRVEATLALLADADPDSRLGRAARADDRALCWPHLRRGLATVRRHQQRERLVALWRHGAQQLLTDLAEFQRKLDHRYRDEPRDREQGSWRRAVLRVVGLPHHTVGTGPGGRDRGEE